LNGLKELCLSVFLFSVSGLVLSQALLNPASLLHDGGFEDKKFCPGDYNNQRLRTLSHWDQPTAGTSDHFVSCSARAGVPLNRFGDEPALEGDAYGGLVLFSRSKWRYREYLSTEFKRALAPGEWVCASAWLSSADKAGIVSDGFGIHLSEKALTGDRDFILDAKPQMENPSGHFIEVSDGWIKLSDAVQAEGGERWLTMGNFQSKGSSRIAASADAPKDASDWAYVYVDGVELVPVDSPEDCACLVDKIALDMTDPPEPLTRVRELERDTLHFGFDEDQLSQEDRIKLDRWGGLLRRNRFLRLEVHGHTDARGPEGYNSELSRRRAGAAFQYLMDIGVAPGRMRTAAHGSTVPAATNADDAGRAQNRRVEFRLVEHAFLEVD
jgi:OOP family OmpA-OmpF porin